MPDSIQSAAAFSDSLTVQGEPLRSGADSLGGAAPFTDTPEWLDRFGVDAGFALKLGVFIALTILFLIAFRLTRRFFTHLRTRVTAWDNESIKPIRFHNQVVLPSSDVKALVGAVVSILRFPVYLVLLALFVNIVFGIFDATRYLAAAVLNSLVDGLLGSGIAVLHYLPNLLFIVVIAGIAWIVVRVAGLVFTSLQYKRLVIPGFYPEWARSTFNLVRFFVIVFGMIVAVPYLPGAGSTVFQGVSIFLGVLISFGSTAVVANIVAGLALTYMRAFTVGDRVRIAQTGGDIVEKTLFVTRIRTPKNVEITIPNASVLANHIINYSALREEEGVILHTPVTIGYDIPWQDVHAMLVEAAKRTEDIEADPEPFVLQTDLGDFSVRYELNATTRNTRAMQILYSRLHENIQDVFTEKGVEIMSPQYTALRDGNESTLPEGSKPEAKRGFRFFPPTGADSPPPDPGEPRP